MKKIFSIVAFTLLLSFKSVFSAEYKFCMEKILVDGKPERTNLAISIADCSKQPGKMVRVTEGGFIREWFFRKPLKAPTNYIFRQDVFDYKLKDLIRQYQVYELDKAKILEQINKMDSIFAKLYSNSNVQIDTKYVQKPKSSSDDNKIVPAGSGSGFFVSKEGHVISNYHVIEGCDINKLSFKGSQTKLKVLAVDKVNDIAILKADIKPNKFYNVSNEDVSLLEDVIVAGFPLGKQISSAIKTHKGVVTALAGAGDNYSLFQTNAAINQGNSGGPILNEKGNIVGIAVATWVEEGVQGVHFGIKSSTLKTFANANGLNLGSPNLRKLSNKDLGNLITKGTVYVECHMTVAKIKKMIAQAENRKAFFKEHK